MFPPLRTEMAMTLGGTVSSDGMNLAALVRETQRWNLDPVRARATATKTAELALQAVDEALIDPDGPLAAQIRRKATEFMD